MAITTSILAHIIFGHLMFIVTNINAHRLNFKQSQDLIKCMTSDGHQGFCMIFFQCNDDSDKTIKQNGEDILILKKGGDEMLKHCPTYKGLPQWCCRNDTRLQCGVMKSGLPSDDRKQIAKFGGLSWSVALLSTNPKQDLQDTSGYFCGASLIHPSVVLTAAHCFSNRNVNEIRAQIGAYNLHDRNELIQTIGVKKIIRHEDFYEGSRDFNIALLDLSKPAELKGNVGTVCLPTVPQINSNCYASGWGKDINNVYPSIMAKIHMNLVLYKKCQKDYNDAFKTNIHIPKQSFCAMSLTPDKCAVDSGSPIVCKVQNTQNVYMQYGIMSISPCRKTAVPGVYTNVAFHRDWIDITIKKLGYNKSTYTYS